VACGMWQIEMWMVITIKHVIIFDAIGYITEL